MLPTATVNDGFSKPQFLVAQGLCAAWQVAVVWRRQTCCSHSIPSVIATRDDEDVVLTVDDDFWSADGDLQRAAALQAEGLSAVRNDLVVPHLAIEPQVLVLWDVVRVICIKDDMGAVEAVQCHTGLIDQVATGRYGVNGFRIHLGNGQLVGALVRGLPGQSVIV